MVNHIIFQEIYELNTRTDRMNEHDLLSSIEPNLYKSLLNVAHRPRIACVIDEAILNNILDFLTIRKQLHIQALQGNSILLLIDNLMNSPKEVEKVGKSLQTTTDTEVFLLTERMKRLDINNVFLGLATQNLNTLVKQQRDTRKGSSHTLVTLLEQGIGVAAWQQAPADILLRLNSTNSTVLNGRIPLAEIWTNRIVTDYTVSTLECLNTSSKLFEAVARVKDASFLELTAQILIINDSLRHRLAKMFTESPLKTKQQIAQIIVNLVFPDQKLETPTQEYIVVPLLNHDSSFKVLTSANVCSRSELRRLFSSNAIRKISPTTLVLTPEYSDLQEHDIIRIGKRYLIKLGEA